MNRIISTKRLLTAPAQQLSRPSPCSCLSSLTSSPFSSSAIASTSALPTASPVSYTLPKGLLLKGIVTSTGKMAQTSTVTVERRVTDDKTLKAFKKHTSYLIHDPLSTCVVGDQVSIRNCRPISKRKRFELVAVLQGARERVGEEAKVADAVQV